MSGLLFKNSADPSPHPAAVPADHRLPRDRRREHPACVAGTQALHQAGGHERVRGSSRSGIDTVIPHGVDAEVFHPVSEEPLITLSTGAVITTKAEAKEAFGYEPDGFLITEGRSQQHPQGLRVPRGRRSCRSCTPTTTSMPTSSVRATTRQGARSSRPRGAVTRRPWIASTSRPRRPTTPSVAGRPTIWSPCTTPQTCSSPPRWEKASASPSRRPWPAGCRSSLRTAAPSASSLRMQAS